MNDVRTDPCTPLGAYRDLLVLQGVSPCAQTSMQAFLWAAPLSKGVGVVLGTGPSSSHQFGRAAPQLTFNLHG